MIHHEFFNDWKMHFIRADGASTLLDVVNYGMELARRGGPSSNLDLPGFFDLRAVDLSRDSADDLRKAVYLRKSLKVINGDNPCAYVVGSYSSYGNMRMYGSFAELHGLRKEEFTIVTMEVEEAIDWLVRRLDLPEEEAEAARDLLRNRTQAASQSAGG